MIWELDFHVPDQSSNNGSNALSFSVYPLYWNIQFKENIHLASNLYPDTVHYSIYKCCIFKSSMSPVWLMKEVTSHWWKVWRTKLWIYVTWDSPSLNVLSDPAICFQNTWALNPQWFPWHIVMISSVIHAFLGSAPTATLNLVTVNLKGSPLNLKETGLYPSLYTIEVMNF